VHAGNAPNTQEGSMNAMLRHIGLPYHGSSTPSGFTGTSLIAVTVAAVLGVAIGLGVGAYTWRDGGSATPGAAAFTLTAEGYTGAVNEALFDGALPLEVESRPAAVSAAELTRFAIEQHDAMFEPYAGPAPVVSVARPPMPTLRGGSTKPYDGTLPLEAPGVMVLRPSPTPPATTSAHRGGPIRQLVPAQESRGSQPAAPSPSAVPRETYASKYIWHSYGCGRIRNGSTSFSYL